MKEISVRELKLKMDNGDEFQLVDVREQYEHDTASIEGSLLIPMGSIMENYQKVDRNIPVIVHCKTGKRSASVISVLEDQFGFDNLYNLKGGIIAYIEEVDPSLSKY